MRPTATETKLLDATLDAENRPVITSQFRKLRGRLRSRASLRRTRRAAVAALVSASLAAAANAQPPGDRQFLLHHNLPVGQAARMHAFSRSVQYANFQPIRVELPSTGTVSNFEGVQLERRTVAAPAHFRVRAGYAYRFQIADMPEFPGIELFPTVEILDQLQPPPGLVNQFPVPIQITDEEIRHALQGKLVTKVVFLEQPQRASLLNSEAPGSVEELASTTNLLAAADQRGRPMAIIRLGGRQPARHGDNHAFFLAGSPIKVGLDSSAGSGSYEQDE